MRRAFWLRMLLACAFLLSSGGAAYERASAVGFSQSAVVVRAGNPTLLVDGRPFFFYGAAFFYERIPAPRWRASMLALRTLGFNTLDLYVPWNWHELGDGDFDFSGRTNARRNLRAVLALAAELNFKLIVRPGPVIRNEWRNGGYPAWLLTRPEYGMPLHDVLEGRYPATATLQNANSDDAAAQWLGNATHMKYARRWLQTALREFLPVADRVIAVQLDDDQGAYIDNQTWPAPHLQTYLRSLEETVRSVVGPQLPVFINTYEMKVTASAPVWPMGNWYQSDAYSIGEHDRAGLEFSAGLLQTQTHFPLAISEFQAGWLAQPEDPTPRPADPTNTTLALHTLLGMGMRGTIDFPAQDTLNPAGWEAPFANASYAWDAALTTTLAPSARYGPTARFGELLARDGAALAGAHRLADGAIAYLPSAYDESRLTNADVFAIAARTGDAQRACRARHLACDLVDLRFVTDQALARYPFLIVPSAASALPFIASVSARLDRYRAGGGRVLVDAPDAVEPHAGGIPDATLLLAADGRTALLDVLNYDTAPRAIARTRLRLPDGQTWLVGPLSVPARDAVLLRSDRMPAVTVTPAADVPVGAESPAAPLAAKSPSTRVSFAVDSLAPTIADDDRAEDGYLRITLSNGLVSMTLAPAAGGRAFALHLLQPGQAAANNAFTTVGSLRDDVAIQPPLSVTDRIGKYTRSFPAGMFNRPYEVVRRSADNDFASVTLRYFAPDVVPSGAQFERTISLKRAEHAFAVSDVVEFGGGAAANAQRAMRYDSFASVGTTVIDDRVSDAVGFFSPDDRTVAIVSWAPGTVEDAQLIAERTSTVLQLRFAPGGAHITRYAFESAENLDAARELVLKERSTAAAKP